MAIATSMLLLALGLVAVRAFPLVTDLGNLYPTGEEILNRKYIPQRNCKEIYDDKPDIFKDKSGLYLVQPDNGGEFVVFCDMSLRGDQWTVIQRRVSDYENFDRPWACYRNGFGDLTGDFWLGLEKIRLLTQHSGGMELYIGFEQHLYDATGFAHYKSFKIGTEDEKYKLTVGQFNQSSSEGYNCTAGDSLSTHSGMKFSTPDQDNDPSKEACATVYKSGWWFNANCIDSNLNGNYYSLGQLYSLQQANSSPKDGIVWEKPYGDTNSLKSVIMAIRPSP